MNPPPSIRRSSFSKGSSYGKESSHISESSLSSNSSSSSNTNRWLGWIKETSSPATPAWAPQDQSSLPLNFFPRIQYTPVQVHDIKADAPHKVQALRMCMESGSAFDLGFNWIPYETKDGIQIAKAHYIEQEGIQEGQACMLMRGVVFIPASIEGVLDVLATTETHEFRNAMHLLYDPLLIDCLCLDSTLSVASPSESRHDYTMLKWLALRSMHPQCEGVDYLFVEHCGIERLDSHSDATATATATGNNKRVGYLVHESIQRREVPSLEGLYRLQRQELHRSGILVSETDREGIVQIAMVCQTVVSGHADSLAYAELDMKARIYGINKIAPIVERKRLGALKFIEQWHWVPNERRKECHVCHKGFTLRKKHHCRACGEVVCGNCAPLREVELLNRSTASIRICTLCAVNARKGNHSGRRVPQAMGQTVPAPSTWKESNSEEQPRDISYVSHLSFASNASTDNTPEECDAFLNPNQAQASTLKASYETWVDHITNASNRRDHCRRRRSSCDANEDRQAFNALVDIEEEQQVDDVETSRYVYRPKRMDLPEPYPQLPYHPQNAYYHPQHAYYQPQHALPFPCQYNDEMDMLRVVLANQKAAACVLAENEKVARKAGVNTNLALPRIDVSQLLLASSSNQDDIVENNRVTCVEMEVLKMYEGELLLYEREQTEQQAQAWEGKIDVAAMKTKDGVREGKDEGVEPLGDRSTLKGAKDDEQGNELVVEEALMDSTVESKHPRRFMPQENREVFRSIVNELHDIMGLPTLRDSIAHIRQSMTSRISEASLVEAKAIEQMGHEEEAASLNVDVWSERLSRSVLDPSSFMAKGSSLSTMKIESPSSLSSNGSEAVDLSPRHQHDFNSHHASTCQASWNEHENEHEIENENEHEIENGSSLVVEKISPSKENLVLDENKGLDAFLSRLERPSKDDCMDDDDDDDDDDEKQEDAWKERWSLQSTTSTVVSDFGATLLGIERERNDASDDDCGRSFASSQLSREVLAIYEDVALKHSLFYDQMNRVKEAQPLHITMNVLNVLNQMIASLLRHGKDSPFRTLKHSDYHYSQILSSIQNMGDMLKYMGYTELPKRFVMEKIQSRHLVELNSILEDELKLLNDQGKLKWI